MNTKMMIAIVQEKCKESELEKIYEIFKELTEPEDIHREEGDFKVSGATIFVVDLEESKRI